MNYFNVVIDLCRIALVSSFPKFFHFLKSYDFLYVTFEWKFKCHGNFQLCINKSLITLLKSTQYDVLLKVKFFILNRSLSSKLFDCIEIVESKFLNFLLNNNFLELVLKRQFFDIFYGVSFLKKSKKIILDFSSPNIAKKMHIGHLRSTIVGNSLCKIFKFKGYVVKPINHVGDWGANIGMLITYIRLFNININELTVTKLEVYYKQARILIVNDLLFKLKTSREILFLQKYNTSSLMVWNIIFYKTIFCFNKIYRFLNINLIIRGESFYNYMLDTVIFFLTSKKLIRKSNGALCIYLKDFLSKEKFTLPILIKKSDGTYNYLSTDFAALIYRTFIEKVDLVIYVTDVAQSLHFKMLFDLFRLVINSFSCNFLLRLKLEHVPCGFVLNEAKKKIKTREGTTKKVEDFIDDVTNHIFSIYRNENNKFTNSELNIQVSKIVINTILYTELMSHRLTDYIFNIDESISKEGNTFIFVLYTYARIQNIKRKQYSICDNIFNIQFRFSNLLEYELLFLTCKFPHIFNLALLQRFPHKITEYLYKLASGFNVFFEKCRIFGGNYTISRLFLCRIVSNIMKECFFLLGIKPLDKI